MTWAHRLIEADWLDTGPADPIPWADADELTPRLHRARALGYSHLLVYGDREHFANLHSVFDADNFRSPVIEPHVVGSFEINRNPDSLNFVGISGYSRLARSPISNGPHAWRIWEFA